MSENISDHELLIILQTDPDRAKTALSEIWQRYYNPLCVLAYRISGDYEDARDIVSEVFVQLWSKKDTSQHNIVNLKPYLMASVFNNALFWKRKENRRASRNKQWSDQQDAVSTSHTESSIILTEYYETLYKALDNLPPRTREVFLLYLKGNSTEAISILLGLDKQTVLNHKSRAIHKLISLFNNNPSLRQDVINNQM